MIQDLKLDSQRWQQEQGRQEGPGRGGSPYAQKSPKMSRHPNDSLVAYQDSRTHAARQHWGPSQAQEAAAAAYEQPRQPARAPQYPPAQHGQSAYAAEQHYTTTPTAAYSSSPYAAPAGGHAATPRIQPDAYANYPQAGREHQSYPTPQYAYPQHGAQDSYRQPAAPPPIHGYAAPRYFGHFDPYFLVYR
jgi:hypothetical protein